MRFEEAYGVWAEGQLTQEEAGGILGLCDRTFRRYIHPYQDEGMDGLFDMRLTQASSRRAPVSEPYGPWGAASWVEREAFLFMG